jgi:hypothetical protein
MLNCSSISKQQQCVATCSKGYGFALSPKKSYDCLPNPVEKVPDCSKIYLAQSTTNLTVGFALASTITCTVVQQYQKEIKMEALNNAEQLLVCSNGCGKVEITDVQCNSSPNSVLTDLNVVYQLTAENANDVTSFATKLQSAFNNKTNTVTIQVSGTTSHYVHQSGKLSQTPVPNCLLPEHALIGTQCMCCPPGAYLLKGNCTWCPIGTYQAASCQTSCRACPSDTTTNQDGARSQSACVASTNSVAGTNNVAGTNSVASNTIIAIANSNTENEITLQANRRRG